MEIKNNICDKGSESDLPIYKVYTNSVKFESGVNVLAHRHSFIEIEMITAGRALVGVNGKTEYMDENYIYILRPTDVHTFMCKDEDKAEIMKIHMDESIISGDILDTLFKDEQAFVKKISKTKANIIKHLFDVLTLLDSGHSNYERMLKNTIDSIFSVLLTDFAVEEDDNDPIKFAVTYLNIHFAQSPTLETLANLTHYNSSYFSKLFHSTTSYTYVEYLNRLKINCAKKLLAQSKKSIIDIGAECGFSSHSNFLRAFANIVGSTPGEYRKSINKNK